MAYNARATKSSDDFTSSPGRKIRSTSLSDASPATNITEESSDALDRYSLLSLGAPYERWYIDLTGPHPRSERGHTYILTCVGAFTKWAELKRFRSAPRKTSQLLKCSSSKFSAVSEPQYDCSVIKEVDGNITKQVCGMLRINKLRTSPYKPSTNQVERLYRSINAVVASRHKDWIIVLALR